jgi:excisionase family DNA binding protein
MPARFSPTEAAEYLGVERTLVYRLCDARKIRHRRVGLGRGKIQIEKADLDAYLESCVIEVGVPEEPFQFKHVRPPGHRRPAVA